MFNIYFATVRCDENQSSDAERKRSKRGGGMPGVDEYGFRVGVRARCPHQIDDPLDAFAVHGCCGFWGCIATALFSVPAYAWGAGGGTICHLSVSTV